MFRNDSLPRGHLSKDSKEVPYEVKLLTVEHSEAIMLQEYAVVDEVGEGIYAPYTESRLKEILQMSLSTGVFVDEKLVAYRTANAPMDYEAKTHRYFPIPASEQNSIVNFCGLTVVPEFRKFGLAKLLTSTSLSFLADAGWKHFYATGSPFNFASMRYLFSCGFRGLDAQEKYDSGIRLLMYQPARGFAKESLTNCIQSSASQHKEHEKLFADGFSVKSAELIDEKIVLIFSPS